MSIQSNERTADEVAAVFVLMNARKAHPELNAAVFKAHAILVAAIIAMDKAFERGPAIAEQAAVEIAIRNYSRALADLVRGQADSSIEAAAGW